MIHDGERIVPADETLAAALHLAGHRPRHVDVRCAVGSRRQVRGEHGAWSARKRYDGATFYPGSAAVMTISTRICEAASLASTVARVGRFALSIHASQAAFISSKYRMSDR